jgi:hypothetical protein
MAAIFQFISHLLHAFGTTLWHDFGYTITTVLAAAAAIVHYSRRWRLRFKRTSAHSWPAMSATIDIVSVAPILAERGEPAAYKACLTYFYRNPDLQLGDYERVFALNEEARLWCTQFKGRQVTVHVNPSDPADSVLLPEEIETFSPGSDAHIADAARQKAVIALPSLAGPYRLVAVLGELVATAGLAAAFVLLGLKVFVGASLPHWVWWTEGGASLIALGSCVLVWFRLHGAEASDAFLKAYMQWCPAWMRWTAGVGGTAFALFWLAFQVVANLPEIPKGWVTGTASLIPYLWPCFIFFSAFAFLHAVVTALVNVQMPREVHA